MTTNEETQSELIGQNSAQWVSPLTPGIG